MNELDHKIIRYQLATHSFLIIATIFLVHGYNVCSVVLGSMALFVSFTIPNHQQRDE